MQMSICPSPPGSPVPFVGSCPHQRALAVPGLLPVPGGFRFSAPCEWRLTARGLWSLAPPLSVMRLPFIMVLHVSVIWSSVFLSSILLCDVPQFVTLLTS